MLSSVPAKSLLPILCILVSMIILMTGLFDFITLNRINIIFEEYNNTLKGMDVLKSIQECGNSVMSYETMLINTEEKEDIFAKTEFSIKKIYEQSNIYQSLPMTQEEELKWKEFSVTLEEWIKNHEKVLSLLYEKKHSDNKILENKEDLQEAISRAGESYATSADKLNDLIERKRKISEETFTELIKQLKTGRVIIINSVLIGIIMVIMTGILITGKINKSLSNGPEERTETAVLIEELYKIAIKLKNTTK